MNDLGMYDMEDSWEYNQDAMADTDPMELQAGEQLAFNLKQIKQLLQKLAASGASDDLIKAGKELEAEGGNLLMKMNQKPKAAPQVAIGKMSPEEVAAAKAAEQQAQEAMPLNAMPDKKPSSLEKYDYDETVTGALDDLDKESLKFSAAFKLWEQNAKKAAEVQKTMQPKVGLDDADHNVILNPYVPKNKTVAPNRPLED
jgi:hypothetical protein